MCALRGLDRDRRKTMWAVFGCRSCGRFRFLQAINLLNEQEDYKGDDNKVKCGLKKDPVIDGGCPCCLGRGEGGLWRSGQIDEQAGEIHLPHQQSNGGHQHVADERRNDFSECSTHNHTDRHVEHVAFHGEVFEFFQHISSSWGLLRCTALAIYHDGYRFLVVSKLYPRVMRYRLSVSPVPGAGALLYRVVTWMLLTKPATSLNRTPLSIDI